MVEFKDNEVRCDDNSREHRDEDEQAPASTDAISPDESLMQRRRLRLCVWFGWVQRCVGIQIDQSSFNEIRS
jgi:hypothetical protein